MYSLSSVFKVYSKGMAQPKMNHIGNHNPVLPHSPQTEIELTCDIMFGLSYSCFLGLLTAT